MMVPVDRRTLLGTAATAGAAALVPTTASASRRRRPPAGILPAPGPIYAAHRDPADLGVLEAASLLNAGLLSSAELTAACQARIAARNGPVSFAGAPGDVNAFIRTYPTIATATAAAADRRRAAAKRRGQHTPALTGIPLALKDLYAVSGLPVTASSKVLGGDAASGVDVTSGGNVASGNSTAWANLARAGMVLLGHAHTDEFAFLAVTPQCGNPWDTTLITGGSSGGPAAALAARMTPAALGSDTLGSLRVPAAFCGVSSIKPTYGLISSYGVIPLCWSLDTCGPMARSVADCALLLDQLAGPDPADASTDLGGRPRTRYATRPRSGSRPLTGTRIAVATNLGTPATGPAEILARTTSELGQLGATLLDLALPANPLDGTTGLLESYTDALAYHGQFYPAKVTQYGTPAATVLSGVQALNVSGVQYLNIMRSRASFQAAWKAFLAQQRLDAVLCLISVTDPVARAAAATANPASNPENTNLLTYFGSYLGFPAVTVPGGVSSATKLPVGLQLIGAPLSEAKLIQLAVDLQHHFPHHLEDPYAR